MQLPRRPHALVWSLAREYIEAAEHLLDVNRLQPAIVLASLASEILLKSFLVEADYGYAVRTERGHEFIDLFSKLSEADRDELVLCSKELDPSWNLYRALAEFGGLFVEARYRYEPQAPQTLSCDAVYFSRHFCECVYLLGRRRGV